MNRIFLLTGISALLLASQAAMANSERGFAVAAGFGTTTIEDDDGAGDVFDGSDVGWSFDLEYRFLGHFAFGLTVLDLGETSEPFNGADTRIQVDGAGLYVRAFAPLTDRLTVYARVGEISYEVEIDPGFNSFFPFNDSAIEYGAGLDFGLTDNLALRLEGRILNGEADERGSLTSIGLAYKF